LKLSTVQELKERIETKAAQIEALRGALESVSIPILDGLPKVKSPQTSKIERLTAQIVDVERELENLRGEFAESVVTLTREILERVKGHSAQKVLILRYCAGKSFKEICFELSYSKAHIFRLHQQGVKQFNSAEQKI